jgi:hypothetical protein
VPLTHEAIAAHHADDCFRQYVWTELKFPYTWMAARAIYIRLLRREEHHLLTDAFRGTGHPSGSGVLAHRLIDRLARAARRRDIPLMVALLPPLSRFVEL